MISHGMTRRAVLRGIAAVLPCVGVSLKALGPAGEVDEIFSSLKSARHVGRAFLALYPEEGSQARLAALTGANLAEQDPGAWRTWLAQRRRQELRDEQVVEIDGWVLALSEARLCALRVVKSD